MFSRLVCQQITNKSNRMLLSRLFSQKIATCEKTKTNFVRLKGHLRSSLFSKTQISNLSSEAVTHNPRAILQLKSLDINTNVTNNVFLYKFERPIFFRCMNAFGVLQMLFWIGISYLTFKEIPPRDSTTSWMSYLNDNFIRIVIASIAVLAGTGSAFLIIAFTSKSVKYIILNKGGKTATFVTYHPISTHKALTVPIDRITCKTTRTEMKNYLPLKVQGRPFYYIVDAGGKFLNPVLFDFTVGSTD